MQTVFCDESGFTGDNLWEPEQPYFAYAAVAISEERAAEIIKEARSKFRLKSPELHAMQLLRNRTSAVKWIIENVIPTSSVILFNKRFALAGKMFEYLIEPAVSNASAILYDIGFHKFIANGLYVALLTEPTLAESGFQDFQNVMRSGDATALEHVTASLSNEGLAGFLNEIATFVTCNRRALEQEIAASPERAVPRWMLELTTTALISLLTSLSGDEMMPLSVICDDSKPLLTQAEMFDGFVGREDCRAIICDGRRHQLTFNLAHPIRFGSSKAVAGLQLADLVAGSAVFALKRPDDDFSSFWREISESAIHKNSVIPELREFDLSSERGLVNAIVLKGLVERSVLGRNLALEMPELVAFAEHSGRRLLVEEAASESD
jgi:hypothetical protein